LLNKPYQASQEIYWANLALDEEDARALEGLSLMGSRLKTRVSAIKQLKDVERSY
jgi:hypothetical protein